MQDFEIAWTEHISENMINFVGFTKKHEIKFVINVIFSGENVEIVTMSLIYLYQKYVTLYNNIFNEKNITIENLAKILPKYKSDLVDASYNQLMKYIREINTEKI